MLIDTLEIGGAEKSLLEILPRFEHTRAVICHLFPGEALKQAYETAGIPVISLRLTGRYSVARWVRAVSNLVREERPDLIHSTLYRSGLVGRMVSRQTGVPLLDSLVNDSYCAERFRALSTMGKLKLRTVQWIDRLTAPLAYRFIAISEAIKHSNARALGIPMEKISVIHRGRDPRPFLAPTRDDVSALRTTLNLPNGCPVLLNVARLLQRKGQEDLLRAMPLVWREVPDAQLLIAGEGPYRASLQAAIERANQTQDVHLLGERDDVPTLLQLADLFVFPSHYEGHGGALVEAMFAGRPIVAADTPVHRESITHHKTGLLVPAQDPDALARGIVWMLRHANEARQMGERARQEAAERFHIERVANRHEEVYQRVLRDWRRAS